MVCSSLARKQVAVPAVSVMKPCFVPVMSSLLITITQASSIISMPSHYNTFNSLPHPTQYPNDPFQYSGLPVTLPIPAPLFPNLPQVSHVPNTRSSPVSLA